MILQCKNISKKYKGQNNYALNSINLNIIQKEIIGLLGPNGAGKTTLIKVICGLIVQDNGKVIYGNQILKKNKIQNIGVVLEGARNLYWRASVKSNLYYLAALQGQNRKTINQNIEKYDHFLNIKPFLNKKVNSLSLGQKQKIALVSTILTEPKILILDEPTNGLDIEAKEILANLLIYLKCKFSTTILIASHDVDFTRKIVNKFIIIDKGKIKEIMLNDKLSNKIIEDKYLQVLKSN